MKRNAQAEHVPSIFSSHSDWIFQFLVEYFHNIIHSSNYHLNSCNLSKDSRYKRSTLAIYAMAHDSFALKTLYFYFGNEFSIAASVCVCVCARTKKHIHSAQSFITNMQHTEKHQCDRNFNWMKEGQKKATTTKKAHSMRTDAGSVQCSP